MMVVSSSHLHKAANVEDYSLQYFYTSKRTALYLSLHSCTFIQVLCIESTHIHKGICYNVQLLYTVHVILIFSMFNEDHKYIL